MGDEASWSRVRCRTLAGIITLASAAGVHADETSHPVVPALERVHEKPLPPEAAGRVLLGELACTACHKAEAPVEEALDRKQAPILDRVGARVRPEYLKAFLGDPGATKPGTTMPNVMAGLPKPERAAAVESLVHFLASTGALTEAPARARAVADGERDYHRLGCVACHGSRVGKAAPPAGVKPLGDLAAKTTLPALAAFLKDPLAVRPSGRMPALQLDDAEAPSIAAYLLKDLKVVTRPNVRYEVYEGEFKKLPDFAVEKPVRTGERYGFALPERDDFAMRFRGILPIEKAGEFRFWSRSDDGSRVWIDGKLVVDNDGIHPPQEKDGTVTIEPGIHVLEAAVFDGNGGEELTVEIEGPGLPRQPVDPLLHLDEASAKAALEAAKDDKRFRPDPDQVVKGRALFGSLGCASCHVLREGDKPIESTASAPALASLKASGAGCLAETVSGKSPHYGLKAEQRAAILEALVTVADVPKLAPAERIAHTSAALNCYACHKRDGRGGVDDALNPLFVTQQPEMGDEGRVPPPLDGVGGKLKGEWLAQVLRDGTKVRPYMLARMPKFGEANVGHLAKAFETLDLPGMPAAPSVDFGSLADRKIKSTGRFLVGAEAFGCIKCHDFRGVASQGVRAIDLSLTERRLNRDWFARYVLDPQAYRPGTRMPTSWPDGQSTLPKILDGDTAKQVESVWRFLADGDRAAIPYGLGRDPIPLVAESEAVMYRNFIEGAGTRAIGVGYPEKANIAFDANDLRPALIWRGAFMDASRHWTGRGEGFQPPLGDDVIPLPPGAGLARLESPTAAWPKTPAREQPGTRFLGYRLDAKRRPTFRYEIAGARIEDFPEAVAVGDAVAVRRTLAIAPSGPAPLDGLWLRLAISDKIEPKGDDAYAVGNDWSVRLAPGSKPLIRPADGRSELLLPVGAGGEPVTIVVEYRW